MTDPEFRSKTLLTQAKVEALVAEVAAVRDEASSRMRDDAFSPEAREEYSGFGCEAADLVISIEEFLKSTKTDMEWVRAL